jgi:plasmid stabilization system protein ParE
VTAYALTPLAKADIFRIWCYIAEDSEAAADRVEQAIYNACAFVAEAPLRGHSGPKSQPVPFASGR